MKLSLSTLTCSACCAFWVLATVVISASLGSLGTFGSSAPPVSPHPLFDGGAQNNMNDKQCDPKFPVLTMLSTNVQVVAVDPTGCIVCNNSSIISCNTTSSRSIVMVNPVPTPGGDHELLKFDDGLIHMECSSGHTWRDYTLNNKTTYLFCG